MNAGRTRSSVLGVSVHYGMELDARVNQEMGTPAAGNEMPASP